MPITLLKVAVVTFDYGGFVGDLKITVESTVDMSSDASCNGLCCGDMWSCDMVEVILKLQDDCNENVLIDQTSTR